MTLQADKATLQTQINRYMTLLSNLEEPPVSLLSNLDYLKGLVQFANQAEITPLQQTWGQIRPTDLRSRRYIETGDLMTGPADKIGKADYIPQPMVYKAGQHTGAMIALFVPPDVAGEIADPDGEPAAELHCTLAYLGKAADLDPDEIDSLKAVCAAAAHIYAPLRGFINGIGLFVAPDDETDPIYLVPDLPTLPEFRQRLIDHLADFYLFPASDHGYSPHITLKYIDRSDNPVISRPSRRPITFGHISLVLAGQRYDWPLTGERGELVERAGARHTGGEYKTLQEGHDLFVSLGAACEGMTQRAGARHSAGDRKMIQRAHDIACELGADCQGQPMERKAQTSAPNYKPASTPRRCENCAHYNPDNYGQCRKFDFAADPDYVCDDWAAMKPDEIPGYKPISKGDMSELLRLTRAVVNRRNREER